MVSELPQGWAETTIGEICAMGPKSAWDDGMEIGFVPMSHAPTNFRGPLNYEPRPWHEVKKAYTHFENGDVIFAKVTPCFENGKAALASGLPNGAGAGSSEFHVLRRRDAGISPGYLLAVIKSAKFLREGEENMTGAVGLRRVPRAFVESYPVRLPPEAEQKRIAQKLDALLAQVDTLKARIDAIPALLKRFKSAALSTAVNGELTTEAPFQGRTVTLQELVDESTVGIVRSSAEQFEDISDLHPYLKMNNINQEWGFNTAKLTGVKASKEEVHRYELKSGDWLFNTRNSVELVGKSCVWNGPKGFIFNNNILRIRFTGDLLPEYAEIWFKSPSGKANLEKIKSATTSVAAIYQKSLMKEQLPLPPVMQQQEIVHRVEQLFAYADQLETKVAAAQKRIDALTQSLLAKAFRGELVPQDPSDEPASVLLERIRTQRAATPKPKRGHKAATS
ncbi:restriction endonuclease subunit S [Xanthomonas campestris]|uniref:restriction endonuclease subunit S n=1 Tax=Xanthomonas campestris TaxID=339 RepID=UPI001EDF78BD|nr:restriction endonuclease subunit S [Xanthomonas campestris]